MHPNDITFLKKLKNLEKLNLRFNEITDITPLIELTNLTELTLWNNKLTEISLLGSLKKLTRLSIFHGNDCLILRGLPIKDQQRKELKEMFPNAGFN